MPINKERNSIEAHLTPVCFNGKMKEYSFLIFEIQVPKQKRKKKFPPCVSHLLFGCISVSEQSLMGPNGLPVLPDLEWEAALCQGLSPL